MNANARKWVEALRSGEFKQTTGALRKDDSYCCLGVACELYSREVSNARWLTNGDAIATFALGNHEDDWDAAELPAAVSTWLGLSYRDGAYQGFTKCLAADNDNGATFDQIAATIESEPEGLFIEGVK